MLKRVDRRDEGIDEEMADIPHVVAEEGGLRDIIGAKVRLMLIVGVALGDLPADRRHQDGHLLRKNSRPSDAGGL